MFFSPKVQSLMGHTIRVYLKKRALYAKCLTCKYLSKRSFNGAHAPLVFSPKYSKKSLLKGLLLNLSLSLSLSLCSLDLNKHKKNPVPCRSLSLSQSFCINHSTTVVTIWSLTSSHSISRWSLASMAEFFSQVWWRNCLLCEVQYWSWICLLAEPGAGDRRHWQSLELVGGAN